MDVMRNIVLLDFVNSITEKLNEKGYLEVLLANKKTVHLQQKLEVFAKNITFTIKEDLCGEGVFVKKKIVRN